MWVNTVCGCGSALEGEEHAEVRLEGAGSWVNAKDDLTLPSLAATLFHVPFLVGIEHGNGNTARLYPWQIMSRMSRKMWAS